jgi:multiple sugar transport system substrate-binding protein
MNSWKEQEAKYFLYKVAKDFTEGKIDRRKFFRYCGLAGLGFSTAGMLSTLTSCVPAPPVEVPVEEVPPPIEPAVEPPPVPITVADWLKEVSAPYKGRSIRVISEATPPSRAIDELTKAEFMPATGINVEWELTPLAHVLKKVSIDAAGQLGANDVYYLDQSWIARFAADTWDPRELIDKHPELTMPDYNFDDILGPLMEHIGMYKGKLVGMVCDIPIFIMMYRKDIFEKLGLTVPTDMDQYLSTVKAINDELAPEVYGTAGQHKSGHYSLFCDYTAWLWSHGGSVFLHTGECVVNDEKGIAGLEYMEELRKYMPAGATTWDWSGQAEAVAHGKVGLYISWGEFFPMYDTPEKSAVVGLMEPADCPKEREVRPPAECGFLEKPGISHQGGSVYALSRYSKNLEPTWIFLQWATSSDVQTRAAIMGGGASPVRHSTFEDPRVAEMMKVAPGTTRHFPVTKTAILERMGAGADLPAKPEIAIDVIGVELGKLHARKYRTVKECADVMKRRIDQIVGIYA